MGVLPDHQLVCQLLCHHHLPMLAMPHPIIGQRNLFCLLVHCGIPIWIRMDITIPHDMYLVIPTYFFLFWVVCHPSMTFPRKGFEREP